MRLAAQTVNAYLACDSSIENYVVISQKSIFGCGDFTFALTLGIIPDPNSISVLFFHEATITCRWKINTS